MRWYEWLSIAAVATTALLCSTLFAPYWQCRCYMLTQPEQHAVWRASSLAKWVANDWRARNSPDRQRKIAEYDNLSDTLYDILRRRGRIGSLATE